MEQDLQPEKLYGTFKRFELELDSLSLVDHICIVNLLSQVCQRRQAITIDEEKANQERLRQEKEGAPHLVARS